MYLPLDDKLKHPAWAGLEWIWTPEDLASWPPASRESRYFRQTIHLRGEPVRAWIQVWSDQGYGLWVNGLSAHESPRGMGWSHRDEIDHLLRPGENNIAIEFYGGHRRYWYSGLLVAGEIELSDGGVIPIRSDTTWQCRQDGVAGWNQTGGSLPGWQQAQRTLDGWKAAGSPVGPGAGLNVDYGSFDPSEFERQVASFYGVGNPHRLHVPGPSLSRTNDPCYNGGAKRLVCRDLLCRPVVIGSQD